MIQSLIIQSLHSMTNCVSSSGVSLEILAETIESFFSPWTAARMCDLPPSFDETHDIPWIRPFSKHLISPKTFRERLMMLKSLPLPTKSVSVTGHQHSAVTGPRKPSFTRDSLYVSSSSSCAVFRGITSSPGPPSPLRPPPSSLIAREVAIPCLPGAGNSETIGEVLNDSNCLSNERRT
eukprot:768596-Hanusia_phi.AAC.1